MACAVERPLRELPDRVTARHRLPPPTGIERTVKLTDASIAATAIDLGLPVLTPDHDYDQMAKAHRALHVLKV
jgi:predicted nucleic acid-binding protein